MSKLKLILYLGIIINLAYTQIVTVASTSTRVAASKCNYTFTITNITNIASLTISYTQWGFYYSSPVDTVNTKAYVNGQLANLINNGNLSVISSSSNFGSTLPFTIVLTNMLNPASTKPYLMNLTFSRASAPTTITLSTSLTVNAANHQLSFTIRQNNRNVGASTSAPSFDFDLVNYFDNNTQLNLVFDNTKINISLPSSSFYTVSQGNGKINISRMSFSISNTLIFSNVTISNPRAALTYTIDAEQFFMESTTKYIYAVASITVTLLPIAFNTLSIASPLSMGSLVNLAVSSTCNFTQVSSPNQTAYTHLTFDTNIDVVSGSDCSLISSTQCRHIKSGSPYSLTNFRPKIGSSNATITFTAYTYFLTTFYQLCTGQTTVNFTTQKISPYIVSSECNGNSASNLNSINIYSVVESAAEGDTAYISLIKGVIVNSLLWRTQTVNETTYLKFTVSNSTISVNGTKQLLKLPLVYTNPNETSTNTFSDFYLQRGLTKYAIIANAPVAVCDVTTAKQVVFYSSFPTSLVTYQLMNLTLSFSYQIFDYAYNDSIIIEFKSLGASKQYFLGGSLLGKAVNLTVNNVYCSFSILNDTAIKIILSNNITLPTLNSSACTIIIYNLVNPPMVDTYWVSFTSYDAPTGGMKETFDSSRNLLTANVLTQSIADVYLLKQNSLTLKLTGTNRNILSKNMSNPFTLVTITIPSQINCTNFPNNTISFNWSSALPTSTGFASVNSSTATISLGSCFVSYFIGSLNFSITERVNTVVSTSTIASVVNICGDDCYQCSSKVTTCSACFNSTNNQKILLFGNTCYSNCPSGSFLSGTTCVKCHGSCATCSGESYSQCLTCASNFLLNSSTCLSVCGVGKYTLNGVCVSCHQNCNHCISSTSCYICKQNAVLLGKVCEFSSCTVPCSTCSGTLSTCTSCSSGKLLYLSHCYDSCPSGTYQSNGTCSTVNQSASFFPVSITGLVCLMIVFLIRRFANIKIGNASRRSLSYSQGTNRQVNYNINVIRLSFVIFAYLQLVATLVLLMKGSTYSLSSMTINALVIGIIVHFASNIAFLIGFLRIIYKNRVDNNDDVTLDGQRQFSMKNISFKVIMALSIIFSFKTFKLLFANLFIDREGLSTQVAQSKKQIDESQNNLADQNIVRVPPTAKKTEQPKVAQGSGRSRYRSQVKKEDDIIPSRKPIRSNSFDDNNNLQIQRTQSMKLPNPQDSQLSRIQKSFQCFLNGLTLVNLACASLAIIVGCIMIALMPDAIPVIFFHGLDCLVVTAISLGLTVFDTWSFNCLKVDEQSSEMESKGDVNNTHENLKQQAGLQIKIQPERKTSRSTKKITSVSKPKMSQRSQKSLDKDQFSLEGVRGGIKRECDEQTVARNEKLPDLKMFEADFDEGDDNIINEKKTKKFSTKNLQGIKRMGSRRNQPTSNRRGQGGNMFDDLFINFNAEDKVTSNANPTTKYASRRSLSPQHSLREGSIKLQDELQERAPNFTDISDIEDDAPDHVNASIASELINMNFTKPPTTHTQKQ